MRIFLFIYLVLLFLISPLGATEIVSIDLTYLYFILLIIPFLFNKDYKINKNNIIFKLILVISFAMMFSGLLNSSFRTFLNGPIFFFFFYNFCKVFVTYFKEETLKIVSVAFLISQIPTVLMPIIFNGINSFPYTGVFINPNSLGLVLIPIFVIFLSIFFYYIERLFFYKNKPSIFKLVTYFIVLIIIFTLIVFTRSRTSFLSAIFLLVVGILLLLRTSIKYKRVGNFTLGLFILIPLILILYFVINYFLPLNQYISEITLDKFASRSGNILSGRGYSWSAAFNNTGLFGNGQNFFIEEVGVGAHNTFINVLGIHGWFTVIPFVIIFLVGMYYSYKFYLNSNSKYKFLPIFLVLNFVLGSMGEDILFNYSMVSAVIGIGVSYKFKKEYNAIQYGSLKLYEGIEN